LAWVDATKTDYRRCLDRLMRLLPVGGTVLFDNLLWKGWVAEPPDEADPATAALAAFNPYLMVHPQLRASLLPLGDGVGVAVKTRPVILEMGGPF
jgi:predicted O-methyltransferase YrrM